MKTIKILTAEEIMKLQEPPKELIEQHLYYLLSEIRHQFYNNIIDRDTAIRRKDLAVATYRKQAKEWELDANLYQRHIEDLAITELLRIELRRNLQEKDDSKALDTALKIINTIFEGEEYKRYGT